MADRTRPLAWALAALATAPFVVLVVRAAADVWRAPAVVPQRFGLRAVEYVASSSASLADAVVNSLIVAGVATTIGVVVAWPAARAIGEGRLRRPVPVFLALALPLLVAPYATGTGLVTWFLRLELADTLPGLVLAHLVYVVPYAVLLLAPGFGRRVTDLEEAARSLGAGPVRRLTLVVIPAVAPTLAAAALLAFLVSWSQYGTSLAVGGGVPMLPLVLVPFVGADPQIAALLALVFLAPAIVALAVAARALRRP